MKLLFMSVAWVGVMLIASQCAAVLACTGSVVPSLELRGDVLRLSDLLKADTCPELLQAAMEVRLGAVPSPGSVRIFAGSDIAARLRKLAENADRALVLDVPERVSVRQGGRRWYCREITARFTSAIAPGDACGAGRGILGKSPLQIVRQQWDPAAKSWDLLMRCQRSADCVPFLIRLPEKPGDGSLSFDHNRKAFEPASGSRYTSRAAGDQDGPVLVRRGERVILVWDQDGIRLLVPSFSLEEGRLGQTVRVRTLRGDRVLRGVIESAARLRVP